MIGSLKVSCKSPLLATREELVDLDANWVSEYARKRHEGVEEDAMEVKRNELSDLDANWVSEYA